MRNHDSQMEAKRAKVKEFAQSGIETFKKVDWKVKGEETKVKAVEARDKIVSTWKSGKKGKFSCIVGALGLLWIGSCIFGGSGTTFTNAVDSPLQQMLLSSSTSNPGDAFYHDETPYVRVLSVVDDGVLVCYVSGGGDLISNQFAEYAENLAALTGNTYDKVIHISTTDEGYVDGNNLKSGVYVRDGTFQYVSRDGAENTIESYSKISDEDEVERFKEELECVRERFKRDKEDAAAAKLREEKASGEEWIKTSGVRKLFKMKSSDVPSDQKLVRVFKVSRMFGIEERPPEELKAFLLEAFKDARWNRTARDAYARKAIQMYTKESKKHSSKLSDLNAISSALYDLE